MGLRASLRTRPDLLPNSWVPITRPKSLIRITMQRILKLKKKPTMFVQSPSTTYALLETTHSDSAGSAIRVSSALKSASTAIPTNFVSQGVSEVVLPSVTPASKSTHDEINTLTIDMPSFSMGLSPCGNDGSTKKWKKVPRKKGQRRWPWLRWRRMFVVCWFSPSVVLEVLFPAREIQQPTS